MTKAEKARRLGTLANQGKLDRVKLAALSLERRQVIPTRAQIIEHGGGVGGYLKAYRELNG